MPILSIQYGSNGDGSSKKRRAIPGSQVLIQSGPRMQVSVSVESVAQKLQLPVTDVVTVASASHASTEQRVHPARIEMVGLSVAFNALDAIGAPLIEQGIIALIGRDVLQHCTFFYNGMAGSISLAI